MSEGFEQSIWGSFYLQTQIDSFWETQPGINDAVRQVIILDVTYDSDCNVMLFNGLNI